MRIFLIKIDKIVVLYQKILKVYQKIILSKVLETQSYQGFEGRVPKNNVFLPIVAKESCTHFI